MTTIYQDYGEEPEDIFLPLPENLASVFYHLEMAEYTEDTDFYKKVLPANGLVLEVGCGTGRVGRKIAKPGRPVFGIDISLSALQLAKTFENPYCTFVGMDMLTIQFRKPFAAILIPYNTLNLLPLKNNIRQCLHGCRDALEPHGLIIMQLFIPTEHFRSKRQATFQFQMLKRPGGGQIIKEILTKYQPDSQTIHLEERFRVRPMQHGISNADYNTVSTIAGFSLEEWCKVFTEVFLFPQYIFGSFDLGVYDATKSSLCLIILSREKFIKNLPS